MCSTCGCGQPGDGGTRLTVVHDHDHQHDDHEHGHEAGRGHDAGHGHGHSVAVALESSDSTRTVLLEQEILAKNDGLAAANRHRLQEHGIAAINLMSSPGSGKTTPLEHTIRAIGSRRRSLVIEGDQETLYDAERIRATGT